MVTGFIEHEFTEFLSFPLNDSHSIVEVHNFAIFSY